MVDRLHGVLVHHAKYHTDNRGCFVELHSQDFTSLCLGEGQAFLQTNVVQSRRGVLRGLHISRNPQKKLVTILHGQFQQVLMDLRPSSPTYLEVQSLVLNPLDTTVLVPEGCAHALLCLSESGKALYQSTTRFSEKDETSLSPLQPELRDVWIISPPNLIMSEKDFKGKTLKQLQGWLEK